MTDTMKRLLEMDHLRDSSGLMQPASGKIHLRFGDIAVALGYVTPLEVEVAVTIQRLDADRGRPHRLLGQILVDLRCLSHAQVSEVLHCLVEHAQRRRLRETPAGRLAWQEPLVGPLVT